MGRKCLHTLLLFFFVMYGGREKFKKISFFLALGGYLL
jgi:hypothetical protein